MKNETTGAEFATLYDETDCNIMKVAEDSLDPRSDRVNELILFAKEAAIKRIGIANCITFEKEAIMLEERLTEEGFKVVRANCKLGKMARNEILPGYRGNSCNPAGQAKVLEEWQSELNLVLGLCVGHDMVFNAKSKAMTSTLIVKDRKYHHHVLEAFSMGVSF